MRGVRRPGRFGERGMLALEFAILAPILLMLLLFLMACGRYFQTSSLLENAARDGARAATQARTFDSAQSAVDDAVTRTLAQKAPESCKTTASGAITTAGFTAGSPITVEVKCTIDYRDLGLLGIDQDVTVRRSFTSTLDAYRGVR
ncbi:MAG TPA: TadE/TadG family type IV pilus assembly protein [Kribbellaceae bacterium]